MKQRRVFLILILLVNFITGFAQSRHVDTLYRNFVTPPSSAYPRVWWHWMNGNITREGIEKDLKWMKRVGIGGFQNFDAAWATPQIVKKRLIFMTPEWKDAFRFAAKLADSLKLEMAIASSTGWSESGGPWVLPRDGMKKIVWSETLLKGGAPYVGIVAAPPSKTGEFQDLAVAGSAPQYYQDIAVVAYKVPEGEIAMKALNPKISSSGGRFEIDQLTDGNVSGSKLLAVDSVTKTAWINFEFEKSQTIKSVTLSDEERDRSVNAGKNPDHGPCLLSSDDGVSFHTVCFIPPGKAPQRTISFNPISGRFFRVVFRSAVNIAELSLHTTTRINGFEEKAGFAVANGLYENPTPATNDATAAGTVINLTGKMSEDGKLNWTPPPGNWDVIRFGFSLIGTTNHPATAEATGLEVDKLDSSAVRSYFMAYLKLYDQATGNLLGTSHALKYLVTDSWEAGAENWTNNMFAEFKKRRGYDLLLWMPVLTGHIVGSATESEQFLWDFRKTLCELVAKNYYDNLTDLLHKRGMMRYSESHEVGRALIADGMDVKRTAAIPMSAMWTPSSWSGPSENYEADVLESASVAHIYGQNLVAAESMTAYGNPWSWSPEKLKPTADLEMSCGLNRFVIHTSVHQPTDDKIPGLGLGPFGQWFNRHETWAEEAKPWMTYLSRSSYLLQQGRFVADVVYYYGEDDNITSLFRYKLPDVPDGYHYDFINTDALLNLLTASDKQIITPSGMRYQLLALDSNSRYMPLLVLKKIKSLVDAGAVVVGPKPIGSPSLSNAADKEEYNKISDQLWPNDITKNMVFTNKTVGQVLDLIKIKPDFSYIKADSGTKLFYVHRHLANKDIYWINNRQDKVVSIKCSFRLIGKKAEIWHPESAKRESVSYAFKNGETLIPLQLQGNDAVFVMFSGRTNLTHLKVVKPHEQQLAIVKGPWQLNFQQGYGAPASFKMDSLYSWTKCSVNTIKYFSGTAGYFKTINALPNWFKNKQQIFLNLGVVKDIAEVFVNGKSAGVLWNKPFTIKITNLLRPGQNIIQIKVTNLWVNRLIGDQQKSEVTKYTYTTEQFYEANSPLLPSGLLGPVILTSLSYSNNK